MKPPTPSQALGWAVRGVGATIGWVTVLGLYAFVILGTLAVAGLCIYALTLSK